MLSVGREGRNIMRWSKTGWNLRESFENLRRIPSRLWPFLEVNSERADFTFSEGISILVIKEVGGDKAGGITTESFRVI